MFKFKKYHKPQRFKVNGAIQMNTIKKVIIVNGHSWLNKGDAALVITAIELIKKINKEASISIISDTSDLDEGKYSVNQVLDNGTPWRKDSGLKRKFKQMIFFQLLILSVFFKNTLLIDFFYKELKLIFSEISKSDLVLSCGGGYLNPYGKLLYRLALLNAGKMYSKPTIILPVSIENYNKLGWFQKLYLKYTLSRINCTYSREHITSKLLKDLSSVIYDEKADMAFLLGDSGFELPLREEPFIAVSAVNWGFPDSKDPELSKSMYLKFWIEIFKYINDELAIRIKVIPQVIGPDANDDRLFWDKLMTNYSNELCEYIDEDLHPGQIKRLIGKSKMLIGSRMHSNIFALSNQTPVLAVAYLPKTKGIMEDFDLGDLVIDINDLDAEKGKEIVSKILLNRGDYVQKIINKLDVMDHIDAKSIQRYL